MITRRKSAKPVDQAVEEDQWASQAGELGGTIMELEPVREPESSSKFGWEDAKGAEPRTTWVWDRQKQAWVEITEKPTVEELSTGDGSTTRGPIVPRQLSATPASIARKVQWPRSPWKVVAARASVMRVIDALALKSRAPASGAEAGVRERTQKEAARVISEARQQAKGLPIVIVRTIEERARNALGKANDGAKDIKGKAGREALIAKREAQKRSLHRIAGVKQQGQGIIKAVEEKAKAEAENIVARAEEKAENIIGQVEERAEAKAENIVARVEEKARMQAEKIIGQMEEKAEAKAENIIARVEEKAKTQAENIIGQVEERAEAKAENIIARVEEKAEKIIAQVEEKAEAEAENIIARVEEKARTQAEKIIGQMEERAEAKAENIIARVEEKANEQAETIAAEAKAAFQETVSAVEHRAQHILKTAEEKAKEIKAPAETIAKSVPVAPRREEGAQKERPVRHDGTAELVLGPPVDLGKMQKVLNRLTKSDEIRVLDLEGSKGKGISIKLFSRNVAQLPNILAALPEVEKVSDLPRKLSKICSGQRICPGLWGGNEPPARRLLVTMEKRTRYLEI